MAILGFLPVFINNVVCHYLLLFILERHIVYNIYRYIANTVNLIYIDNIVTIFKTERNYPIYLSITLGRVYSAGKKFTGKINPALILPAKLKLMHLCIRGS